MTFKYKKQMRIKLNSYKIKILRYSIYYLNRHAEQNQTLLKEIF